MEMDKLIDKFEVLAMEATNDLPLEYLKVDCKLEHRFTPKLYSREITMPAGILVTSETHKTEHQFILSKGIVSVWTEEEGEVFIVAPYHGITKPGTRRILFIHEEAIWTTFHSTLKNTVEEVREDIIEKYENPFIHGHYINNTFVPQEKQLVN